MHGALVLSLVHSVPKGSIESPTSSHGEKKKDHLSPVLSYKGTNPTHEGATLMT